ncbi:MAG: hypothetical protein LKI42_02560 [Bacteroidales bacterium]|jgi:hypothetical protein|nr:hypothetical protein [Bacteroidales bacterium]MCI1784745.1 hypothetical protein [Bacteroidales bacterium]
MSPKSFLKAFLFSVSLFLSGIPAFSQKAYEEIRSDTSKAWGVCDVYHFDTPVSPIAPKGYKPFYISHFGRHGARFASSGSAYPKIMELFSKAHSAGILTEKGEEFYKKYAAVFPSVKYRNGDLTSVGAEEEYLLASRMFDNYPQVFRGKAKVIASATYVTRCIMTMSSFCDGLKIKNPSLVFTRNASYSDMYFMNPTSSYNPDVKGSEAGLRNSHAVWNRDMKAFEKEKMHPETVFAGLFTDPSYVKKFGNPYTLEYYLYYIAASMSCIGNGVDLTYIFPFNELCGIWESDNYLYYVSKGPDGRQKGRQWAFSWTLLDDIIKKADTDIASGDCSARLRFGHDITIMNMMALLGIRGWDESVSDPELVKDVWQDYRVPMASNLQLIFYRKGKNSDDIIVRLMYNEKNVVLPIDSDIAPYYSWQSFRDYCLERISVARNIIKSTD